MTDLRTHLVQSRLAGDVATAPRSTLDNCRKLVNRDLSYTFGLLDQDDATLVEAVGAIRALCGDPTGVLAKYAELGAWPDRGEPGADEIDADGWINPDQTVAAVERHRKVLARTAQERGRVLLATGHPTGLLQHYGALAGALAAGGCTILTPLEEAPLEISVEPWRSRHPRRLRYFDGVAAIRQSGDLLHTHRPDPMQLLLDHLENDVDLVIADHGLAGAAIHRGIPTLSVADVNDPALPLAQVRGRTDTVLCIDDNLVPSLFAPVTEAMLRW